MQDEKLKITLYGQYVENCNSNKAGSKGRKKKIVLRMIYGGQTANQASQCLKSNLNTQPYKLLISDGIFFSVRY